MEEKGAILFRNRYVTMGSAAEPTNTIVTSWTSRIIFLVFSLVQVPVPGAWYGTVRYNCTVNQGVLAVASEVT